MNIYTTITLLYSSLYLKLPLPILTNLPLNYSY